MLERPWSWLLNHPVAYAAQSWRRLRAATTEQRDGHWIKGKGFDVQPDGRGQVNPLIGKIETVAADFACEAMGKTAASESPR